LQRAAEFAASTNIEASHLFPGRLPAGMRLPADSCMPGASPAQAESRSGEPKRDMSAPVSLMKTCEVTTPTPGDSPEQLELAVPRLHPGGDVGVEGTNRGVGVLEPRQELTDE